MNEVVAIDGPSGAGKGTVARAVAEALGWTHVDTGAMYRAVAWLARHQGVEPSDEGGTASLAEHCAFDFRSDRIAVDGHDVTEAIRTPEMDQAATAVARMPRVRAALVTRQRRYAEEGPVVMEGRDIGSVVFPEATLKLYLDASPEERARRRKDDPRHGLSRGAGLGTVAEALATRDRLDRTRQVSPLTVPEDATVVDTTGVAIEAVVSRVLELVRTAVGPRAAR